MAGKRRALHDHTLPAGERIAKTIAEMTLEEKVSQMMNRAPAIERLGIPAYGWWSEGLHGVARAGRATVFPQAIGMAATFDTGLVERVASAIGDEARAKYHAAMREGAPGQYRGLTFWSPNVNLFRDPRWGRGQETWGEDPFLTGTLGSAFVKGLQGGDRRYLKAAACAKHYAVHSGPEKDRHQFDARVSARDLHETYLRAFRMLVAAGVESVMGAYNRTNGEACCASPELLSRILRDQWRFDGHVVSDCGAVHDIFATHKVAPGPAEAAAIAVRTGCDLECGGTYAYLTEAVKKGLVSETEIDRALARLLRTRLRLGMFDPQRMVPYARTPQRVVDCPAHRKLAREAAARSVVLLKNNGVLPLARDLKRLFVTGPSAASVDALLGNYYGISSPMITILEGIAAAVDHPVTVEYRPGVLPDRPNDNPLDWSTGCARDADATVVVLGITGLVEGEEGDAIASKHLGDREEIGLPPHQVEYLRKLRECGKPVVLVLTAGCALAIPEAAELADAVLYAWYPGEEGGHGVADVLFGRVNPAGRLPVTVVKSADQLPAFEEYAMAGRTYRFMEQEPLFRFGFGLSYTNFRYGPLRLSKKTVGPGQAVQASVTVTNTGARAGDEVVQLYVRDIEASVRVPRLHLEGFERVDLKPGQTETVRFRLLPEQLAAYDDQGRPFVEPGEFEIAAGGCQPVDPAFTGSRAILTVRG